MAFSWFSVTVYMPQRTLKGGYPSWVLQKFALFSSTLFTIEVHIEQLYNNVCYVMTLQTTAVTRQWLSNDHVGTQTDTKAAILLQQERCSLRGPCRAIIMRTS
jgi:hypothetical protein